MQGRTVCINIYVYMYTVVWYLGMYLVLTSYVCMYTFNSRQKGFRGTYLELKMRNFGIEFLNWTGDAYVWI